MDTTELEDLAEAATALRVEIKELKAAVYIADKGRRRTARFIICIMTALLISLSVLSISFVRYTNLTTDNHNILNIVKDATDPKGSIYKNSLKNQNDAIQALVCDNHRLHGEAHPVINGVPCP